MKPANDQSTPDDDFDEDLKQEEGQEPLKEGLSVWQEPSPDWDGASKVSFEVWVLLENEEEVLEVLTMTVAVAAVVVHNDWEGSAEEVSVVLKEDHLVWVAFQSTEVSFQALDLQEESCSQIRRV